MTGRALPVGLPESLHRVDEDLARSEASVKGLLDLLRADGTAPESVTILVQRKESVLGHIREDLREIPDRFEAKA